jgi:hypothetical protein
MNFWLFYLAVWHVDLPFRLSFYIAIPSWVVVFPWHKCYLWHLLVLIILCSMTLKWSYFWFIQWFDTSPLLHLPLIAACVSISPQLVRSLACVYPFQLINLNMLYRTFIFICCFLKFFLYPKLGVHGTCTLLDWNISDGAINYILFTSMSVMML